MRTCSMNSERGSALGSAGGNDGAERAMTSSDSRAACVSWTVPRAGLSAAVAGAGTEASGTESERSMDMGADERGDGVGPHRLGI